MTFRPTKEASMTSSTLIAPPVVTDTEKRRQDGIAETIREARRSRRSRRSRRLRRPRAALGGSPPGAGGRLLQL
jgi:hypothetical protein